MVEVASTTCADIIEEVYKLRNYINEIMAYCKEWRRERDSNPRRPCSLNGFQVVKGGIAKLDKDNNINIL